MRFAPSRLAHAIALGALGCIAAVLIACGDQTGLIPREDANTLNAALDGVAAACSDGRVDDALTAAARFERRVNELAPPTVDRRLIRRLREGARTLERLIPTTCAAPDDGETTTPEPAAPVVTTPETPATTPTTPDETPTTPDGGPNGTTQPPDSDGATPPPPANGTPGDGGGNGGGRPAPGGGGGTGGGGSGGGSTGGGTGGSGNSGSGGTGNRGSDTLPRVNRNNPGGPVAPGQGGTIP